jgi:hypothetical protein
VVRDLIPWDRAIVRDERDSTLIKDLIVKDAVGGAR